MAKKKQKNARRKLHLRTGDTVEVVTGNDLGVRGRILHTLPAQNKVVVEAVNVHFVHEKPGRRGRTQGDRVEKEMPVDASNVMLLCQNRDCPRHDRPVRVRRRREKDGSKVRICVKCDHAIGA